MANTKIKTLFERVRHKINDTNRLEYTNFELLGYLNDSIQILNDQLINAKSNEMTVEANIVDGDTIETKIPNYVKLVGKFPIRETNISGTRKFTLTEGTTAYVKAYANRALFDLSLPYEDDAGEILETVDAALTGSAFVTTISSNALLVTGTGTFFSTTSDVKIGDRITFITQGVGITKTVAATPTTTTALTVTEAFTANLAATSATITDALISPFSKDYDSVLIQNTANLALMRNSYNVQQEQSNFVQDMTAKVGTRQNVGKGTPQ